MLYSDTKPFHSYDVPHLFMMNEITTVLAFLWRVVHYHRDSLTFEFECVDSGLRVVLAVEVF